jgi:tRNA (guanine-N7-)-methyltransferase
MLENEQYFRAIRSFVRRQGRMTTSQYKALETLWSQYGLSIDGGMQSFETLFQNDHATILEIGFGNGKTLYDMAEKAPLCNFIGIEVHLPGVGALLQRIDEGGINNLKLYQEDALEVLRQCIPDSSLSRVQLYFPDPWPKARHHKRRIVQPAFIDLIHQKLKLGGIFHAATDWENYAEHMLTTLEHAEGFENTAGKNQFSPKPDYRLDTKFELRGKKLGHGVWDLIYRCI